MTVTDSSRDRHRLRGAQLCLGHVFTDLLVLPAHAVEQVVHCDH